VPDIVAQFGAKNASGHILVAFAAESGCEAESIERATKKMLRKSVDAMIGNPVWPGLGPESDQNRVSMLKPGKPVEKLRPAKKTELSFPILRPRFGS
jgi:phosphopantothenoylcysteine synthetase/decarboxylase